MFGKLKDWRRIHTRYDRCAHTFFSAICIAATIIFWINQGGLTLDTLDKIYVTSPATGRQVPLSTFVHYTSDQSACYRSIIRGNSFGDAVLQSGAGRVARSGGERGCEAAEAAIGAPAALIAGFQGSAQAFQKAVASSLSHPRGSHRRLYYSGRALRELYPSAHNSFDTSVRGAGAFLFLMLFHEDMTLISLIGILLLIGIVKKNGIMMVDFAISAQRERGLTPVEAIREACLLRFRPIMMTTMAAILAVSR